MTKNIISTFGLLALAAIAPSNFIEISNQELPVESNNLILLENNNTLPPAAEKIEEPQNIRHRPTECPRNFPSGQTSSTSVADTGSPQHCLESNCGLGVYVLREDEVYERCSYCNALRPKDL